MTVTAVKYRVGPNQFPTFDTCDEKNTAFWSPKSRFTFVQPEPKHETDIRRSKGEQYELEQLRL
jgi:hypothetical protein